MRILWYYAVIIDIRKARLKVLRVYDNIFPMTKAPLL